MEFTFRPTQLPDIDSLFSVRERTRENPIPRERLAAIGITPASVADALENDRIISWGLRARVLHRGVLQR